ncbi:MAG TPA: IPT/TIG domain-containing protein [Ohtaekwangia sp.]|uniref:IPT/TIG domain-containing protein n=1 Tax=Ohtaekwangia sp. TaxID=2066019 RepID=UPI002F959443
MKRFMKKIIFRYTLVVIAAATVWLVQSCKDDDPTYGTPKITEFSPASGGPVGTFVTITGTYFSTTKPAIVKFNGVQAETLEVTGTSIVALVPSGASSGKISVEVEGHTGSSTSDFAVTAGTPAPAILSFTPTSGNGVDTIAVTISGVNFSSTASANTVKFNGVTAKVIDAAARSLTVLVPKGTTTGRITVEVEGVSGIGTSRSDFSVPTPTISNFIPSFSIVGSTVVIMGKDFNKHIAENIVKFNGVQATVVKDGSTTTTLTVIVPGGATTGKITVEVDGVVGKSSDDFTVTN